MTSPTKVAQFHAEFDRHRDDRVRLFGALSKEVSPSSAVLYPGSFVDIAPSVWFDDVTYVDTDKRAKRFFDQKDGVSELIAAKRRAAGQEAARPCGTRFYHLDYQTPLPLPEASVDLLVSLYAGFVSESCCRYVRSGGLILANDSHGDASMASLDAGNELLAVMTNRGDGYSLDSSDLESYLKTKSGSAPTVIGLHESGRGPDYKKDAFAYLFRRR